MDFTSIVGGVSFSYSGDVVSLCTYHDANGHLFWVGECADGYLYGDARRLSAVRSLSRCFRYAPPFSTKGEAVSKAGLSVCRGDAVPQELVGHVAGAASRFSSMPGKKEDDLPFRL